MKPFGLRPGVIYRDSSKGVRVLYWVLQALTLLCMVWQLFRGGWDKVMLCVLTLALLLLPALIEFLFKVKLPTVLVITTLLFVFFAEILGGVANFYTHVPHWDTALHITTGFFAAGVGLSLVDLLNRHTADNFVTPLLASLVAFCFSMTVGVAWEFFEYGCDRVVGTDMQKDRILRSVETVELDPKRSNTVVRIDGVEYTVLYDAAGNELARIEGGYLDVGVTDTMKDMGANLIGAAVFSAFGYLYFSKKEKYGFAGKFLIRPHAASLPAGGTDE